MCFVIITCYSILWSLLSIVATLVVISAVVSPQWLIGQQQEIGLKSMYNNATYDVPESERTFHPTYGIFNRCTRLHKFADIYKRDNCATYVTGFDMPDSEFPNCWKAALFFFSCAAILLCFTFLTAIMSLCARSICKKSIFTVTGLVQSIAGLLSILGMVLYPGGWGSDKVKYLCGEYAGPFVIDNCTLGWSFYLCIVGTLLVFLCSVLSIKAESSTSSQKVEEEILEGKNLICVV